MFQRWRSATPRALAIVAAVVLSGVPALAVAQPAKLLITQVEVYGGEYVVIKNPGATTVSLADVYLTDATFTNTSSYYYNLPDAAREIAGGFNDFTARFPDTASIAPGESLSISINGSNAFFDSHGLNPHFELHEDLIGGSPGPADDVPDMREARPGSILNNPSRPPNLNDGGEVMILFYWDGASDLVTDLDYAVWGGKAEAVDKTGVAIDGPDADTVPSPYLDDTPTASQSQIGFGNPVNTYLRIDDAEGTQIATGGNGVDGRNETSENLFVTFADQPAVPPGIFVPDVTPPELVSADGEAGSDRIDVTFNEAMGSQAGIPGNYTVTAGSSTLTVLSAAVAGEVVQLTMGEPQEEFRTHTVTVSGVADTSGNSLVGSPSVMFTTGAIGGGRAVKLLITQINVYNAEYVVIKNPTGSIVDLSNYYLTDATFAGGDQFYYNLPNPGLPIGGDGFGDFFARFPEGARIGPGDEIAISMTGSTAFQERFSCPPSFELIEDGGPDQIPDMRPARPGSIDRNAQTFLSNAGEVVVLFFWDGLTDLVTDIDYVVWGDKAEAVNKTRRSIDGPDSDRNATEYQPDIPVIQQDALPEGPAGVMCRIDDTEGTQVSFGGNGVDGRNETSEPLSVTFTDNGSCEVPCPIFRIQRALPGSGKRTILLEFTKDVGEGGGDPTHYQVSQVFGTASLIVESVAAEGRQVTLTVSGDLVRNEDYRVRPSGIFSAAGDELEPGVSDFVATASADDMLFVPPRTLLKDFGDLIDIDITIDDARAGTAVTCRIFDLQGRLVRVLLDTRIDFTSGQTGFTDSVTWDGRDESFELVRAGSYICHLMVTGPDGKVTKDAAPIVVATRLE